VKAKRDKFTYDELKLLAMHLRALSSLRIGGNTSDKLLASILLPLSLRVIKHLDDVKTEYVLSFQLDERLAFMLAFEKGYLRNENVWSKNFLQSLYNSFHKKS
jgi:hypothetical protein